MSLRKGMSFLFALVVVASISLAADLPHVATETVDRFHEALAAQDREGALALLADDVLIFESGGAEFSREEYAGHHLVSDMDFAAATTSEITDRQVGQDRETAWVLTRTSTTGTFRGKEIDARGVETVILRHRPDGWRIVHIHWSSRAR